jgi:hypothetical protein
MRSAEAVTELVPISRRRTLHAAMSCGTTQLMPDGLIDTTQQPGRAPRTGARRAEAAGKRRLIVLGEVLGALEAEFVPHTLPPL